jgi:hypothetical protein
MATTLTQEQLATLKTFAAKHGRNWKTVARDIWDHANPTTDLDVAIYCLRNTHGPSWLTSFRLNAAQ